jgi:hypothetical protein
MFVINVNRAFPYLLSDFNLIQCCHHLILLLPFTVTAAWVKGHCTGPVKTTPHVLNNDKADKLATGHNKKHHGSLQSSKMPLPIPGFQIRLLYDNSVITSKLNQVIAAEAHTTNIQKHIQRKAKLTPAQFHKIHWVAHGRAFCRLTSFNQISTSKLLHQLVHTNCQSHLLYASSASCPGCGTHEEFLEHVLLCQFPATHQCRESSLQALIKTLTDMKTPKPALLANFSRIRLLDPWCHPSPQSHSGIP